MIRQPIVSILGHVDHGKTTIQDKIRGTQVAAREAGGITQHIGATEVPLAAIRDICGDLMAGKEFKVPGLLFIDTPGHHAFATLRARGGALADLAVLVVDVNEGPKPQTVESIRILKQYRTPFVIAANKIDMVPGWRKQPGLSFAQAAAHQSEGTLAELDRRLYEIVGKLTEHGVNAERYDRVGDFTTTFAIVPTSGKHGEGIPDLLLVLIGLAQRYLESQLETAEGPAEGTVLEVKEEKGLGLTLDAIVYQGVLARGDQIVVGTTGEPIVTKVRSLLKPKPLDEIRDPQDRFDQAKRVTAAVGVKIVAAGLEEAVAGAPIRGVAGDLAAVKARVAEESAVHVETQDHGVLIKADAIGSLEGLAFECRDQEVPVGAARLGPVSRRDVIDAATTGDPLERVILAFNVRTLEDANEELQKREGEVDILANDVIFRLLDDYAKWKEATKERMAVASRLELKYPAKLLLLPDHTFRASKPAIVGVRVLAGRIRQGEGLLKDDGRAVGRIESIHSGEQSLKEATAGSEVAVAISGATAGRQIHEGDVLYVDIPESHVAALRKLELTSDEVEALDRVCEIKRKGDQFWGM